MLKLCKILLFLCISNVYSIILPLPGSIYSKRINFPLIGYQLIQTEIITDNLIYLTLEGLVNECGTIRYINLQKYINQNILNKKKIKRKINE